MSAQLINLNNNEVKETTNEMKSITVENLISKGRKGVTNAQMIPALKNVLNDKNEESVTMKLNLLYDNFSKIFESSAKYMPDNHKLALEQFVQEKGNKEFKLEVGKKSRYEIAKEIAKPTLKFADVFKSTNNEKLANMVRSNQNWKNGLSDDEIKMVEMAIMDHSTSEIGELFNYNKDKVYTILFRNNGKSIMNRVEIKIGA